MSIGDLANRKRSGEVRALPVRRLQARQRKLVMKNEHAVALGRLGGHKGGKARAAKLSRARLSEIGRLGANTRWSKMKAKERFETALKKNRSGRHPLRGVSLSHFFMSGKYDLFRFNIGEPIYKKAGLQLNDTLDLQIDAKRKLGRLVKISPVPGEAKGNKLIKNTPTVHARTLQVRFTVDTDFRELLMIERTTQLTVVEAKDEAIVFELPLKPDWKKAAQE